MTRTVVFLSALGMAALIWQAPVAGSGRHNFSISVHNRGDVTDCSQVEVKVDDWEVARSEEQWTIPASGSSPLRVVAETRGGILVRGWDRNEYSITACKGAAADQMAEAQAKLRMISVSKTGGPVTVSGPPDNYWMAYLIIQAPRGAALDLEATNGPIGLRNFTGSLEARSQNGPLSLHDVQGKVRADVTNGPITVEGNAGDYRLEVQNGPLSIKLAGDQWRGDFEGHAQNGPLSVEVPSGYRSGVRVDTSGHGPVHCRAPQCSDAVRTWDRPNRIEFGGLPAVVRLSAENGPVNIK